MVVVNVPFFDPPARELAWAMDASKMVGSIQNLAGQMALHNGHAEVTPADALEAIGMFFEQIRSGGTGIIVPSGLSLNKTYEPHGS
jgi:hypothetical protein